MKKSFINLLFSASILLITSCTSDFEEYNTNPYDANDEQMQYDAYSLRAAMVAMQGYVIPADVNLNQFTECLLGGSFGGYLADSNSGFVGKNYATYNPEQHWIQVPFNDIIPKIYANQIQLKNVTTDPVPLAVADIIKVAAIHRVTDIYGHIPYSKIGEDGKLEAPYDLQKDVYNKMFEELDHAIEVLTPNQTSDFSPYADKVYGGEVLKWIKFANSLKLRLAMRIVYADAALAQSKAEEAVNHEVGTMSSNDDNAYNTVAKSPFRVVMFEYNGGDSRISADITSYMNGYADPRREKYFTMSTFENTDNAAFENGYYGLRSGANIASSATAHKYSNMNIPESYNKLLWMNAAECAFLKAEGALRGWNMGGSANEFYNQGIELSFNQWGVSGAATYAENATSIPDNYKDPLGANDNSGVPASITIKWNDADEFELSLERIITQKWIANFPLGHEAWSEFRRTGYPRLMEVPYNLSNGIVDGAEMARRLPYPLREYKENSDNLKQAISNLGGPDNMATKVWWDCKNKN
ncbi:RagB/SusD family nutrient uptake outer membrane protein [Marinifilum fragile]|uniref:RagB/SusD family nutrient uptake outer membrane protein n=1 Tax=Marinifilum fragile TaxID=570161 RepID=UPI002AA7B582|nr:RagB/SusD family nutrient uptake outer membrane protein [Marinifilum fragile]